MPFMVARSANGSLSRLLGLQDGSGRIARAGSMKPDPRCERELADVNLRPEGSVQVRLRTSNISEQANTSV